MKQKGFTLIELLVAISILAVLTTIGLVIFFSTQAKARDGKRVNDLQQIQVALEQYYQDIGSYPAVLPLLTTKYLAAIPSDPKDSGSFRYIYTALPDRCTNNCTSYQITGGSETNSGNDLATKDFIGKPDTIIAMVVSGGSGSVPTPIPTSVPSTPAPTSIPPTSAPAAPTTIPPSSPTSTPIPTPVPCTLTNAYWSTTTAMVGDTVYLNVTGSNCYGYVLSFTVQEADVLGYDPVTTNPAWVIFVGNQAQSSWVAEWQEDGLFGIANPPEYYFIATVNGSQIHSTNQLVVNQASFPTPTPTATPPSPTPSPTSTPTSTPTPTPTPTSTPTPTPTPTSTPSKANGELCSTGSECQSGNCYVDADGDRYAPSSGTKKCQANSQIVGTDCYDSNANAHPGQTNYYPTNRGDGSFDYNCDGAETKYPLADCVNNCPLDTCLIGPVSCTPGFYTAVPACGQSGQARWSLGCFTYGNTDCSRSNSAPYGKWCTGQEFGVPASSCSSYKVSSTGYSATMPCR